MTNVPTTLSLDLFAEILSLGAQIDAHRKAQTMVYKSAHGAPLYIDAHGYYLENPIYNRITIENIDALHPERSGWTVSIGPQEAQPVGRAPTLAEAVCNLRDNLFILTTDLNEEDPDDADRNSSP